MRPPLRPLHLRRPAHGAARTPGRPARPPARARGWLPAQQSAPAAPPPASVVHHIQRLSCFVHSESRSPCTPASARSWPAACSASCARSAAACNLDTQHPAAHLLCVILTPDCCACSLQACTRILDYVDVVAHAALRPVMISIPADNADLQLPGMAAFEHICSKHVVDV